MEMKTIKEIADELGIDKQKVYRYIKKNHINDAHHDVHQKSDVMHYGDAVVESVKAYFFKKNHINDAHQNHIKSASNDVVDTVIDMLKNELEAKNNQLEIKDKQIEEKDNQIKELVKVIDQEQQLRLLDKQKIIELEQGKEMEENVSEDKPKSFFERIMGSLRG